MDKGINSIVMDLKKEMSKKSHLNGFRGEIVVYSGYVCLEIRISIRS